MYDSKSPNQVPFYIQENPFLNKLFNDSIKQGLLFCEALNRIELAKDMLRINKIKKVGYDLKE